MSQNFPKPYEPFGGDITVKYIILNQYLLSNTKLVSVPVDLSKLSNVVKNDVVKKDVYDAKIKTS